MKTLIVEDNLSDRIILKKIVENCGHEVVEAESGEKALELFDKEMPNLIFLDVVMPGMDGLDVAREVKKRAENNYIPIIFITSLAEQDAMVACMDAGGDDFFMKPFNPVVMQAKLNAFERTSVLYHTVEKQRDKIQYHTDHLMQEQVAAKSIFDKIAHIGLLNSSYINYIASAMSVFNGDLLLVARRPFGGIHLFVGDFTGHGLPAAIGALPTSDIFYAMTEKGFSMVEVIQEINKRLKTVLPTGFFCCAFAAHINFEENTVSLWNGGLPEGYLINHNNKTFKAIESKHLPLGILGNESLDTTMHYETFDKDTSLFIYSDGLTEADNKEGDMFGGERLVQSLEKGIQSGKVFDEVYKGVNDFQSGHQSDDITFIQVNYDTEYRSDQDSSKSGKNEHSLNSGPTDTGLKITFGPESLKNFNPLPFLSQIILEVSHLKPYRTRILTMLTELYSNALEHGVLGLSSSLKQSADGFAEYYDQRKERLEALTDGYVRVEIQHEVSNENGKLKIVVEDSGKGFNYQALTKSAKTEGYSGRGFPLLFKLSDEINFEKNGSKVTVIITYDLDEQEDG